MIYTSRVIENQECNSNDIEKVELVFNLTEMEEKYMLWRGSC